MDFIPEVEYVPHINGLVITDQDGDEVYVPISEARDLGRTLIALADEAGE